MEYKNMIASFILVFLIMYTLTKWIKEKSIESKKLLELKNFIRGLDTKEIDTIDNIIKRRTNEIYEYKELKEEMISFSEEINNQEDMIFKYRWKEIFEDLLKEFKIKQSIKTNIMSLGEILNSYDIDVKEERIKNINIDLENAIKENEEEYLKNKNYKIKIRLILSLLVVIINV